MFSYYGTKRKLAGADWLPFRFLAEHRGSRQKNIEVVWYNDDDLLEGLI